MKHSYDQSGIKQGDLGVLIALFLLFSFHPCLGQTKPDRKFLSVRIDQYDEASAYGLLVKFEDSAITILNYGDLLTTQTYRYDQIVRIMYFKGGSFDRGLLIGLGVFALPGAAVAGAMINAAAPAALGVAGGLVVVVGGGLIGGLIGSLVKVSIYQEVYGDLALFQKRSVRLDRFQMDGLPSVHYTNKGRSNIRQLGKMKIR